MPPKKKPTRRPPPSPADNFEPPEFVQDVVKKKVELPGPYTCLCTLKQYGEQKDNFYQTANELFAANNGYFPVSKIAIDAYYGHMVKACKGDERLAVHRVASLLDIYVNENMITLALARADGGSPVGLLLRQANMKSYAGKTYADTLMEYPPGGVVVKSKDTDEDGIPLEADINEEALEIFGYGYEPEEYDQLLDHYKKLTKQFSNDDFMQDELIKDLCRIKVMQQSAYRRKDMDTYEKTTKLYQSTMKSAGLHPKGADENRENSEDTPLGVIIRDIEKYTPAEVYKKDVELSDVDGVGGYIKRFFLRSALNYFGKTNDKDAEYSLSEEEISG